MAKRFLLILVVALALGLAAGALMGAQTASADPTPGWFIQLPIINYIADSNAGVETIIEVQNLGWDYTKAELWLWGEYSGYCEPQDPGPGKVECTGLLKPGSAWIWTSAQLPSWAKSAWIYAVDECFGDLTGIPLGVEVVRKGPGDPDADVDVTAAYSAGVDYAAWDPLFGGYAFYAPMVYAGFDGYNSWIYIQNSGDECTSVELWFKALDDCLRAQICEVLALAPGETFQFDASTCVGPGWVGSVWLRSTQPLGLVVDHVGNNLLMSYVGKPADLKFEFNGEELFTVGSQVAYGPLIYREQHGWETLLSVQNLSSIVNAKVKVYFLDNSGDIITTLVDWVCPRGNQLFLLPYVNGLPGNYVGTVRVESQEWWTPGDPKVLPPNILGVAHLVKYASPMMDEALEAIAYNLFPEWQAYDWQVGENWWWDTRVIGIPSLMKYGAGVTTELAIQNVVPKPGFTDFAIYIYDQNGLLDFVCEKLNEKQSEYINLDSWGYINPGFKGSAVIAAGLSTHELSYDPWWGSTGLTAVKIERSGTTLGYDIPGDESAGSEGFPLPLWALDFHFQGPQEQMDWWWWAWQDPGFGGICPGWECGMAIVDGNVYDSTTGNPVEGADVCLDPGGYCATTNADGWFVIDNVPTPRSYTLSISASGFAYWEDGLFVPCVDALDQGVLHLGDIEIAALHDITGKAHKGTTQCAPLATDARHVGRTVELWLGTELIASTETDSEGYFEFEDVPEVDEGTGYHLKIIIGTASYPSDVFFLTGDGVAYFDGNDLWCQLPD